MAYFAISFELRYGSEVARRMLCDEIERLGGVEAIGGVYLAELDGSAEEVREHLARYLGAKDRLIVIGFNSPPAVRTALAGADRWIAERLVTSEAA